AWCHGLIFVPCRVILLSRDFFPQPDDSSNRTEAQPCEGGARERAPTSKEQQAMFARRLLMLLATLVASLAATAAAVEERSPFRQGHWWDPSRSGHGFEILSNGGQVMAVWYTYDDGGRPTWYTAQGPESGMGTIWP